MRTYARGTSRLEIVVDETAVIVRTFTGDTLIDEERRPCRSLIYAKWDSDRLARTRVAEGWIKVAGDDVVAANSDDLLAALAANPDDLDTYLVYADYLSERGDPWGQLIAVQHALATLPRSAPAARRDELGRADATLLYEHSARLWGELGEQIVNEATQTYAYNLIETVWYCGFVREAKLDARDAPAVISTFAKLQIASLLRRLLVIGDAWSVAAVRALAAQPWPQLRTLEIDDPMDFRVGEPQPLDAAELVPLIAGETMPALTEGTIVRTRSDLDPVCTAFSLAPNMGQRLERLELRGRFGEAALGLLAGAPLPALRELHVSGRGASTVRLDHLAPRVRVDLRPDPPDPEDDD